MTEYELLDVMEAINGNSITATGVYFSVLTAYLLVAYIAGNQLTKYQAIFINIVFVFYNFIALSNLAGMINTRMGLYERLIEMSGEAKVVSDEALVAMISVFILMRLLLVVGAMGFMWQVRHPKTG